MNIKHRTWSQLALLSFLIAADQISKGWIEQQGPFWHQTVIPGLFNLVKAHNFGVAFSMLADWGHAWRTGLLLGLTMGIALALLVWWWRERRQKAWTSWLLTLVLAGAVGNIWDRIQLGYVVDFIDIYVNFAGREYHWPAFNIADSCITIGVIGLILVQWKGHR